MFDSVKAFVVKNKFYFIGAAVAAFVGVIVHYGSM